jgi:glycosyltransferase involved in cell wall biosynthesis
MKVLLINPGLPHTLPQLEFMVDAGVEVHCLNVRAGFKLERPGIVNYDWCGREETTSDLAKLTYFQMGLRARGFIRALKPDIVHAHYATSAGLIAWLSGYRPYAVTIHGSDLLERSKSILGAALLRRVLRGAQLVNPVAGHMTGLLREWGVGEDRTLVMPFGIDLRKLPFVPRTNRLADGVRLLCTRNLDRPVYDIPTLLHALAKARSQGSQATLTLASGAPESSLKELAGQLGIEQAVTFGGGYAIEDLPALMARHDVYVSSSLWDGASVSLMEAMACGLFPLVSDIPANREWLVDRQNALLFAPGDRDALAQLILSLPSRREFIEQAVLANRKLAEARADREKNLRTLLDRLAATAKVSFCSDS